MKEFNETITSGKEAFRCHFREVISTQGSKYFIQIVDNWDNKHSFEMKKTNEKDWKIVKPAPEWTLALEETLSVLIRRHTS